MNTALQLLGGLCGMVLLYYGAEYLVKGGVCIARSLKVPPVVIGLTLVAFATSAPELVVSIDAALKGVGDVSAGNVIGSNICNIALILGVSALINPIAVQAQLLRFDMPTMLVASFALAGMCVLWQGVGRLSAAVFLCLFAFYLFTTLRGARNAQPDEAAVPKKLLSLPLSLLLVVGGLAGLVVGAKLFVNSAIYFARLCQISEAVIGLTIVALGTSLPELATSAVASFHGQNDIAIGNVVGSNIYNILAILGIAPMIAPIHAPGINRVDIAVMCLVAVELLLMMMGRKRQIGRLCGLLFLFEYAAYIIWLAL